SPGVIHHAPVGERLGHIHFMRLYSLPMQKAIYRVLCCFHCYSHYWVVRLLCYGLVGSPKSICDSRRTWLSERLWLKFSGSSKRRRNTFSATALMLLAPRSKSSLITTEAPFSAALFKLSARYICSMARPSCKRSCNS